MTSITVTAHVTIQRPIEEVFAFIADARNDPQWCPSVREIRQLAGDGPGAGAKYTMRHAPGGMKFDATVEIVDCIPCKRLEWRMTDKGHVLNGVYTLAEVNGTTRLTQTSHIRFAGLLRIPGLLMKGLIKKDIQKEMNRQFANLKQLLEYQPVKT